MVIRRNKVQRPKGHDKGKWEIIICAKVCEIGTLLYSHPDTYETERYNVLLPLRNLGFAVTDNYYLF